MTSPMIKIGIPGAAGRMGRMLIREIDAAPDLELVAASDRAGTDAIGQDSGLLAGTGSNDIIIGDDPAALGFPPLAKPLAGNSIAINRPLARALEAAAGEGLIPPRALVLLAPTKAREDNVEHKSFYSIRHYMKAAFKD